MDDFLDIGSSDQAREQQIAEGRRIASLYTVFETDERAKELLKLWDTTLRRKRTPVNAPVTEYAANEAVRAFVEGIYTQLEIARNPTR